MHKRWTLADRRFMRHSFWAVMVLALASFVALAKPTAAQDWFKTGTGLGVTKARLALPDTAARSSFTQPWPKTFHDVAWADLENSGRLDMVIPSFSPPTAPGQPSALKAQNWAAPPANAYMVAYGNMA